LRSQALHWNQLHILSDEHYQKVLGLSRYEDLPGWLEQCLIAARQTFWAQRDEQQERQARAREAQEKEDREREARLAQTRPPLGPAVGHQLHQVPPTWNLGVACAAPGRAAPSLTPPPDRMSEQTPTTVRESCSVEHSGAEEELLALMEKPLCSITVAQLMAILRAVPGPAPIIGSDTAHPSAICVEDQSDETNAAKTPIVQQDVDSEEEGY